MYTLIIKVASVHPQVHAVLQSSMLSPQSVLLCIDVKGTIYLQVI